MGQPPAWARAFVGIPWAEHGRARTGVDCWGCAVIIWRDYFGLEVPSYAADYATPLDRAEVAALIEGELSGPWLPVPVAEAVPGDAVLLRVAGRPLHVGVIAEAPWFLHAMQGRDTVLERLDAPQWARRVLGVYRHAQLVDRPA